MNPPENYERFFVPVIAEPVAHGLLQAAALQPGERVLDVGCGTGIIARLAARAVGSAGSVAGADPNPGMLAVARSRTDPHHHIDWHQAPAESLPLDDGTVDVVLCQMSLQFFGRRVEGLREMRRVLAEGGRVALNVPGPASPPLKLLADALGRRVGAEAAGFVHAVFSIDREDELAGMLREAGFDEVTTAVETYDLRLPPPRDFLWQYVGSTPLAGAVASLDDDARAALERDVVADWEPFATDVGMRCRQRLIIATGRH